MHEVLVNRLGGLSLLKKSMVRLTDRPDMTLDVYRGRKTTTQQQQLSNFYSPLYRHTTVHNIPVPFYKTAILDEVKHCVIKYELEAGLLMFSKNKEECALLSENNNYMCSRHNFISVILKQ